MVSDAQIEQKLEEYFEEYEKFVEEEKDLTKEQADSLFVLRKIAEVDIMLQNLQNYVQK